MRIPSSDLDESLAPKVGVMEVATGVAGRLGGKTFDRCHEASMALWRALREAGHDALPVQVSGYRPAAPDADPRWTRIPQSSWSHYAVEVDGTVYDLTMGQFRPDAPAVAICGLDDLHRDWDAVYAGEDAPEFR